MDLAMLARVWEMLIGRFYGPLSFRVVLQPLAAVILAIRVGFRDARAGNPPYLSLLAFTGKKHRRELVRRGWQDVRRVFIVGLAMDVIYELTVYRWVYPVQAVIVAVVLAIVPYLLVRGPCTRLASRWIRRNGSMAHHA